jgi:dTDP-4-dehydrorhamnose reductase
MQRLFVTGASGLLGSKMSALAKHYYEYIPLHNTRPLQSNSLRLDITNLGEVLSLVNRLEPHMVIHTASETNVDKCETQKERAWRINVEGTRNIAIACSKAGAKLIFISTDYVFDGEKGWYKEEDEPNPVNYYGLTKLEGEKKVAEHCENYAVLRTSVLYGWHPWKQNFATWVIDKLKQRQEITVVEDHFNTPTLAANLAQMAVEAAGTDIQGLYHASGNERISRYEFAKQTAKTFNLNSDLIKPVKMSQLTAWIARRPKDSSLDTSEIQEQLKTKPLNITEGLNEMKEEMET